MGPSPVDLFTGVKQGVWMGLLWESVKEYEVPVEVSATREPGKLLVFGYAYLKVNDDKTELLIIITREELSKISGIATKVGDQSIPPSDDPPRNLIVIL